MTVAIVTVLIVGLQSCVDPVQVGDDFLEKPPSAEVTQDSIFSSAERAERFLWNAYRSLPFRPSQQHALTDISHVLVAGSAAPSVYYPGTLSPTSVNRWGIHTSYNSGTFGGIRSAHIFIDNIDRVPDMDAAIKRRLKAEARMIIAFHYTQLYRDYGGMPWIDHAFSPNEDLKRPRMTARATLDSTVALIDRAIPNLPFVLEQPSTEAGRFTQAGAMGLKARLLLFAASPLFNSPEPYMGGEAAAGEIAWFGGEDPELWQDAADAAKTLIDKVEQTGAYRLANTGNPREDFRHAYFDRDSPELLISTRGTRRRNAYRQPVIPRFKLNNGRITSTDTYVRMFPMANGQPITSATSGYDPDNPYENRDPRLYETVLVNGDEYQGRTAELWIGGRERENKNTRATITGYRAKKFVLDVVSAQGVPTQFPYLRLPEIYLSYAEALNEINGGPTPEAYEYVNRVRNRVDLGDLPTGLSQEEFREAVLRERALEFGYEEVRWYDLIRWKQQDIFTKTLYGMDIHQNDNGTFRYERWELPARSWAEDFSPKWYLKVFPRNEMLKGYLVQNPGW